MMPEPIPQLRSVQLAQALRGLGAVNDLGTAFQELVNAGLADIPFPGKGETLERWRCLAQVAAHDLPLLKLYEGHTDAAAILDELGCCCRLNIDQKGMRTKTWTG